MAKVFISHTSELDKYPEDRSFVQVAREVVARKSWVLVEMESFTAESQPAASVIRERIDACDVFVGIIGFKWGSPVRDHLPAQSYTEYEYAYAKERGKPRLMFLLAADATLPAEHARDEHGPAQDAFRSALMSDDSIVIREVKTADRLDGVLQDALDRVRKELGSSPAAAADQDSNRDDPPYGMIEPLLRAGKIIPFLGRAASLPVNHLEPVVAPRPTWSTLRSRLVGRLPSEQELSLSLAVNGSYPMGAPLQLATVAQYFEVRQGRDLLDESVTTLHAVASEPRPLHTFLAGLPENMLVVTTNFDDLLERAFAAAGKPYSLIVHSADPAVAPNVQFSPASDQALRLVDPALLEVDLAETSVIYKMHGSTGASEAPNRRFVITEDDWVDFLVRIADTTAIPNALSETLLSQHFLFLGYSLTDWNLRVLLSRLKGPADAAFTATNRRANRKRGWAISSGLTPLEREFWAARNVGAHDITLDDFVRGLAE